VELAFNNEIVSDCLVLAYNANLHLLRLTELHPAHLDIANIKHDNFRQSLDNACASDLKKKIAKMAIMPWP
jgi:hypothetical protein